MTRNFSRKAHAGFTVLEVLVTLFLSSLLLTGVLGSFTVLSKVSHDHELRVVAQLQAQSVVDIMTPEIRMIGNGVPFHQANFLIAQQNLSDNTVTQPILTSGTTSSQIKFRLNESGETYLLMNDYDPTASSTVTLTSVSKIYVGDQIYITNATVGDDDGLWATVASIDTASKSVTFSTKQYAPSATFAKGSLLEVVPIVTYASTSNYGGITRDNGTGAQTLVSNGQFTLDYLDINGNPITLPLVASSADPFPASAIQNVRSIKITVSVQTPSAMMSTGNRYVATATSTVGVRNLNYDY